MKEKRSGMGRSVLSVLVAAALIGAAVPVWSGLLSAPTGIIEGRAPKATGDLYALMPDGATRVTNNVVVSQTATPAQFTVSPDASGLSPFDDDGDTGLTMTPNMASTTLVWKHNGVALTPAQLAAPLVSNFPNTTVTLEVQAPVTVSSTTGLPTTAGPTTFTTAYAVKVPPAPVPLPASVKLWANGFSFAGNIGFPSTGYSGATYTILMDGVGTAQNSAYTYVSDQPWVSVSAAGVVTLYRPPTAQRAVVITITPKTGQGAPYKYSFNVFSWFAVTPATFQTPVPTSACSSVYGAAAGPAYWASMSNTPLWGDVRPASIVRSAAGGAVGQWGENFFKAIGTHTGSIVIGDRYRNPSTGDYFDGDIWWNWQAQVYKTSATQNGNWEKVICRM